MRKMVFMGTGTSQGVPMIGCDCPVCLSGDPRNQRTRTSALIQYKDKNILIDTSIDLRQQALREGMKRLDAILITHTHADHIFGLDDIRRFNFMQNGAVPVYGSAESLENIQRIFPYIFNPPRNHGGVPSIELVEVRQPFTVEGLEITPVPIKHGDETILGFRFGRTAYLTDCSGIPEQSLPLLEGIRLLVMTGLRWRPHPKHFSLEEACRAAEVLGAEQTYFVHVNHDLDHEKTNQKLPPNMQLAYDGLAVPWVE
jgi:phosphoribosyl 1,2-cyclic phosphate phosphodiesterase